MDDNQEDVSILEIAGLALRFGLMVGALVQLTWPERDRPDDRGGDGAIDTDSLF